MYHIRGMSIEKIYQMSHSEREWWGKRLLEQLKKEKEAVTSGK